MEPKVEELQPEEVRKHMTIMFLKYDADPGNLGIPFNVLSVCLPFLIVESFGKTVKVDTRSCTIGLPTDEYVAAYTKMKQG